MIGLRNGLWLFLIGSCAKDRHQFIELRLLCHQSWIVDRSEPGACDIGDRPDCLVVLCTYRGPQIRYGLLNVIGKQFCALKANRTVILVMGNDLLLFHITQEGAVILVLTQVILRLSVYPEHLVLQ
ncbi:hypothetical protein D3C75_528560 [compost metagenome]